MLLLKHSRGSRITIVLLVVETPWLEEGEEDLTTHVSALLPDDLLRVGTITALVLALLLPAGGPQLLAGAVLLHADVHLLRRSLRVPPQALPHAGPPSPLLEGREIPMPIPVILMIAAMEGRRRDLSPALTLDLLYASAPPPSLGHQYVDVLPLDLEVLSRRDPHHEMYRIRGIGSLRAPV